MQYRVYFALLGPERGVSTWRNVTFKVLVTVLMEGQEDPMMRRPEDSLHISKGIMTDTEAKLTTKRIRIVSQKRAKESSLGPECF